MKATRICLPIALAAALALSACGDKAEESNNVAPAPEPAAAKPAASEESSASPAASLRAAASKLAAEADVAKDDAAQAFQSELAGQTKVLASQFSMSTETLKKQYETLADKYQSLKSSLPEETVQAIEQRMPKLELSLESLEDMVAKFSPETMQQLDAFKTKYQNELGIAKDLADEIMKLLAASGLADKIPSF